MTAGRLVAARFCESEAPASFALSGALFPHFTPIQIFPFIIGKYRNLLHDNHLMLMPWLGCCMMPDV